MPAAMNDEPTTAVPVPVAREVFEGIEAVRLSGATNMLDRNWVAELAEAMGFSESARWVREKRDLYARAIFYGFEVTT
jgi:Domain of unknown function (DUF5049)